MKNCLMVFAITVALFFCAGKFSAASAAEFNDPNVQGLHESVANMRTRAAKGDPQAQTGVGMIDYFGFDGTQDFVAAKGWFEKAAEQGYPEAMVQLGSLYENGFGVKKDVDKAVTLYRKAAELNYPQARFRLGLLHFEGSGVAKDEVEGKKLLTSACEDGYQTSCGLLMWWENKIAEARATFNLQCQSGDQMACGFLAKLPTPSGGGGEGGQVKSRDKGKGGVGIYMVIGLLLVGLLIFWLIRNEPEVEERKGE